MGSGLKFTGSFNDIITQKYPVIYMDFRDLFHQILLNMLPGHPNFFQNLIFILAKTNL